MNKKKTVKNIVGLVRSCKILQEELDNIDIYKNKVEKVRKQYEK